MQVGIDFGTSNTSIAFRSAGGTQLIALEPDATSIPTAVFYGSTSGEYAIGAEAVSAYESGEEGRLMRSIKSVLGSSLIDETTEVGRRRLPFRDVIAHFLTRVIARAEAETGERVDSVIQGRPVSFNDRHPELDARAQTILEAVGQLSGGPGKAGLRGRYRRRYVGLFSRAHFPRQCGL